MNVMPKCNKCSSYLAEDVKVCPICGAGQESLLNENVDRTDELTNSPSMLIFSDVAGERDQQQKFEEMDKVTEIKRLTERGDDCFNSGKAWLGAKDRSRARKEFQRAFNYYETVLKLDPENDYAREARSKCLFKMA